MMNSQKQVLHINDLAAKLGCTRQTVTNMVKRGDIPSPMRLGKSRPFWPVFEIETALSRKSKATVIPLEGDPLRVVGRPPSSLPPAPTCDDRKAA